MEKESTGAEKVSVSMSPEVIDAIYRASKKLGMSRSEFLRQAVLHYVKSKPELKEPTDELFSAEPSEIDEIIIRSQGWLGDFQMPRCSRLIEAHGLAGELSDENVRRILARYREHVDFWEIDDETVDAELSDFSKRAKVDPKVVRRVFYTLKTE